MGLWVARGFPLLAGSCLILGPLFHANRYEELRQTPALGERAEVLPQLRTDVARIGSLKQLSDSGGVPSEVRFFARWQDSERKAYCCLQLGSPGQITDFKRHYRMVRANVTQIELTPEDMRISDISGFSRWRIAELVRQISNLRRVSCRSVRGS
jgi:hypothetical protein